MGFQQSKNIFKQWNKFKDHLLLEITEEERSQIEDAIKRATETPELLPFNDQFDGKLRQVVPIAYDPYKQGDDLSRMLNKLVAAGWKIDLNTGVASKDFETQFEGQTIVKARQMKINAIWTTALNLFEKRYQISSNAATKAGEQAKAEGKSAKLLYSQLLKQNPEYQKINNQFLSLLGMVAYEYEDTNFYQTATEVSNEIKEFIDTWKTEAPKLKGKLQKGSAYSVVFSRNPIDVLRMSDYYNISSCHSPPSSEKGGGSYYKCAIAEAIDGGAIALLVKSEDLQGVDINQLEIFADLKRSVEGIDPLSRIRLRYIKDDETGAQLAIPESRVYGPEVKGFKETINTWASTAQAGQLDKILSSLDDNVLDLERFTRYGGSYQDTDIKYLFVDLSFRIPSLKNLKFKNDPKYSGETEERVVYGDIAGLRREVEEMQNNFNASMQSAGLHFDSFDIHQEHGEITIVPRITFQMYLNQTKLAITDEDEIGASFIGSSIGRYIKQMFGEFGVGYAKYFGDSVPFFSSYPPRVIFYIDKYEIFENQYIQDTNTLDEFLTHVYNTIMKVKQTIIEITELTLVDYGIYKGGELRSLYGDVDNNEFRNSDWTIDVVEDGLIPEEIKGSITIEIPINLINNVELFLRGSSSSKFIFNIKKQTTGNIRESNIFFDKDGDIILAYVILSLDKQSDDDVVKSAREMFDNSEIREEFKTKIVQIINDMFKPMEQTTKLNEFKHITNNWKNFLL